MDKKVRMADIAEQLDISVVSVSKALTGKSGVSEETRAKVMNLAKEMGYVPLRTKPKTVKGVVSSNIGILVADHFFDDNTFYANLYRQIVVWCNEQGFSALLELVTPEAERNCTLPAMIQGSKVDGLIFMGQISRDYLRAATRSDLPYILLDFYDEELDADSITSDNMAGGYRLTQHLLETGRRNIGFVGSIHATSSIMDRYLGYAKALLRANIPLRMDWVLEDRLPSGEYLPFILPDPIPQAFLCSCDEVAYNLVEHLKSQGYRVPEDVAVAGYDDYRYPKLSTPQLTTYRVNLEDMGKTVVEQLVRRIKGKHATHGNVIIGGRLIRRQST